MPYYIISYSISYQIFHCTAIQWIEFTFGCLKHEQHSSLTHIYLLDKLSSSCVTDHQAYWALYKNTIIFLYCLNLALSSPLSSGFKVM